MVIEIGKGKVALIDILLMKIKENRRKGRSRDTYFHKMEIEGKLKKIEASKIKWLLRISSHLLTV